MINVAVNLIFQIRLHNYIAEPQYVRKGSHL